MCSFKRPQSLTENDYELTFTYGPDQERIKGVWKENGQTYRTRIYASNYETNEENGQLHEICYISAPTGLCAMAVSENGNAPQIFYTYTDHLGSITAVTNAQGNVIARQNFDAWGRRRNALDYTYLPQHTTTSDNGISASGNLPAWLYRGYTGHEMLDEFALINMNARLYDPVLGMMLSPDNYIQDPSFTQNYNRYGYCFNNPLRYTDPDGNYVIADDIAAGLIGMGINLVTQGFSGNITSWQSCLGYATVGFASGIAGYYGTPLAGGAIAGGGNDFVAQMESKGWNIDGLKKIDWGSIGNTSVSGVIVSGATCGMGDALRPSLTPMLSKLSTSPVVQQALIGGLVGSATSSIGGGIGTLISGGNYSDALSSMGNGALWGFGIGATTGTISGFRYAKQNNLNPWNGESLRQQYERISPLPLKSIQLDELNGKTLQLRNNSLNQDVEFTMPSDAIVGPSAKGGGHIYHLKEGIQPVDKGFTINKIRVGSDHLYPDGKVIFYNNRNSPTNYYNSRTTLDYTKYHYKIIKIK
jgi:RHS repeat-associated protein